MSPSIAGGVKSFLTQFQQWLDKSNIPYTENTSDEYDFLFINSWKTSFREVYQLKKARPNLRIIHRIDGSARNYGRGGDWDSRQARSNALADLTIFQSDYSQKSTTQLYKIISMSGTIIHNPIDTQLFNPDDAKVSLAEGFRVCVSSFSTNRMKGTWQVPLLASANPDIQFILCGNYAPMDNLPNIHQLGTLEREELAQVMRSCDVFLNLSLKEACPNVVVEALASGLPVLYVDSGGTPELVGNAGLPITIDTFRQQLDNIRAELDMYRQLARNRAVQQYSYDVIFPQYWQAITSSQRRPIPTWLDWLKLTLQGYDIWQISPERIQHKLLRRHTHDTD